MSSTRSQSSRNKTGKEKDHNTPIAASIIETDGTNPIDATIIETDGKVQENEPSVKDLYNILCKMNVTLDSLVKGQSNLQTKLVTIEDNLSRHENDITELKKSVSFNADETSDVKCVVVTLEKTIEEHKKSLESMKEEILHLERYSRKFNLRFIGFAEDVNGNSEDCSSLVKKLIQSQLGIAVDIENAHRTGKKYPDKPRHIVAKFLRRPERFEVMNQRGKFTSKGIKIIEDLSYTDLLRRRELQPYAKEAWVAGKKVRFHGSTLHIDGVEFKLPPQKV